MSGKRGRPAKHPELPKEIRDNIVEANLPEKVLEAIKEAVVEKPEVLSDSVAEKAKAEDVKKDPKYIGNCPVTGKPVFE